MLKTELTSSTHAGHLPMIESVLSRIPPLWGLTDYVAVNPFLGYANRPIVESAREIADALGARVLPPAKYFQKRWQAGAYTRAQVERAAERLGVDADRAMQMLEHPTERPVSHIATFAEQFDALHQTQWELFLRASIARYCAVYADEGGVSWHLDLETGLWATWRECAAADRAPELTGLKGYRQHVASLPGNVIDAIEEVISRIKIPADDLELYLYRLIGGLFGWASFFRRQNWNTESSANGPLLDLLAIRLCADSFFAGPGGTPTIQERMTTEEESTRLVLQEATEDAYVQSIVARIHPPTPVRPRLGRDSVQAVFCIDVRSEPLRRHLEAQDPTIRTLGFAGFFGVCLSVDGESARCPVLLNPCMRVDLQARDVAWKKSFKAIQSMPASAFSFVELAGAGYGFKMLKDTCVGPRTVDTELQALFNLVDADLPVRIATGASILKNMSLGKDLARLVLLCGHEGRSANNPHAAGLDCGACGGHGGGINARVAAAILNDPHVRQGLAEQGRVIPSDTVFVAGVHDTSTDEVQLLDTDRIPVSHRDDVQQLLRWLQAAEKCTRRERATFLSIPRTEGNGLKKLLDRRARHWAEVRPEWALARNASFIAARRDRTRGLDLSGRTFLHEYDSDQDPDSSVLSLILSAPVVVASWINLQYFASTVDNHVFGAGNKTIHNRVGRLGVVLGNGGDLRTGLAMQSVHLPGGEWFHEPLRLQVIVEASSDKIDQVLQQHPNVRDLVLNGWIRLFSLSKDSSDVYLKCSDGRWERVI
ncbi:MAG: UPF0753 protein [Phycisphaerae bacterium]|nr:MAG: UPF0753 protein [Phycisphaerae bacterium]